MYSSAKQRDDERKRTLNDRREHPSAHKGANFTDGSCDTVELAAHSCRAGFTRKKAKTVSGTEFTKAQEDTVDDLFVV